MQTQIIENIYKSTFIIKKRELSAQEKQDHVFIRKYNIPKSPTKGIAIKSLSTFLNAVKMSLSPNKSGWYVSSIKELIKNEEWLRSVFIQSDSIVEFFANITKTINYCDAYFIYGSLVFESSNIFKIVKPFNKVSYPCYFTRYPYFVDRTNHYTSFFGWIPPLNYYPTKSKIAGNYNNLISMKYGICNLNGETIVDMYLTYDKNTKKVYIDFEHLLFLLNVLNPVFPRMLKNAVLDEYDVRSMENCAPWAFIFLHMFSSMYINKYNLHKNKDNPRSIKALFQRYADMCAYMKYKVAYKNTSLDTSNRGTKEDYMFKQAGILSFLDFSQLYEKYGYLYNFYDLNNYTNELKRKVSTNKYRNYVDKHETLLSLERYDTNEKVWPLYTISTSKVTWMISEALSEIYKMPIRGMFSNIFAKIKRTFNSPFIQKLGKYLNISDFIYKRTIKRSIKHINKLCYHNMWYKDFIKNAIILKNSASTAKRKNAQIISLLPAEIKNTTYIQSALLPGIAGTTIPDEKTATIINFIYDKAKDDINSSISKYSLGLDIDYLCNNNILPKLINSYKRISNSEYPEGFDNPFYAEVNTKKKLSNEQMKSLRKTGKLLQDILSNISRDKDNPTHIITGYDPFTHDSILSVLAREIYMINNTEILCVLNRYLNIRDS